MTMAISITAISCQELGKTVPPFLGEEDLENILLESDYSSLESKTLLRSTDLWNINGRKKTLLFPHGVCIELDNLQQFKDIKIQSREEFNIYFVDPAMANNIRTEENIYAKTSLGPTSNNYFSYGIYELQYLHYDNSIHEGTSCTDYSKLDTSYGECLNDVLIHESLATYGCLPPWVSTNNSKIICEEETNIEAKGMKETLLFKNIVRLIQNLEADMFRKCLSPCTTMKISLQQVAYRSNWLRKAFFQASSKDWATVHTQVYSYDILSLTVDLGSALGLWLGLSCLSILDYLLENWILMKNYWKK